MSSSPQGSTLGAILLIAGCSIGAAMLGIPILSALAGFKPTLLVFFLSWLFMMSTGLLLLEVNLWFGDEVSIISMATRTLGFPGVLIGWSMFLFLFYSLMVAYISGCGALIADFVVDISGIMIPHWVGGLFVICLFGLLIYLGTTAVDYCNRFLMLGLIISYIFMISLGLPHINKEFLSYVNWSYAPYILPAMILSFGYHNLIPSLTTYLGHDAHRLRFVIIVGTVIPLIIYLLWEGMMLGLVPVDSAFNALQHEEMATRAIRQAVGKAWVTDLTEAFSLFAIVTSILGVALSLVDFLADGLQIKKTSKGKIFLCLIVIFPPFLFSAIYPNIFLTSLKYAGGYAAVILFGLFPVIMVWKGRYYQRLNAKRLLPGGRIALIAIALFSLAVMILQII